MRDVATEVSAEGTDQGLVASVLVRRGGFVLDVGLRVANGEVVALVGPNGAGKSTLLRVLAGLMPMDRGRISLDGSVLADTASSGGPGDPGRAPGRRVDVPAYRRPIGVVFQDYLLFPHLNVTDNVAFGLRSAGTAKAEARERARAWLERVGVAELARSKPSRISGGQAQRVALARALAVEPRLLLLDEPLAALDARTRLRVRGELRRHLGDFGGAAVVVTHDPVDAAVLADRLVVVEAGRVVQQGTPLEVARRPQTDYVARLVGLNLLAGAATGRRVALDGGGEITTGAAAEGLVFVAFRPSSVALYPQPPGGSPRNVWAGRVVGLEPVGESVRVEVGEISDSSVTIVAELTAEAVIELDLVLGARIWAAVKASEIEAYARA